MSALTTLFVQHLLPSSYVARHTPLGSQHELLLRHF